LGLGYGSTTISFPEGVIREITAPAPVQGLCREGGRPTVQVGLAKQNGAHADIQNAAVRAQQLRFGFDLADNDRGYFGGLAGEAPAGFMGSVDRLNKLLPDG
jgi:hypothetical protein